MLFMAYCVVLMGGRLSWGAELGQPCFPNGPKRSTAKRSAGATVLAQVAQLVFTYRTVEQRPPVRNHRPKGSGLPTIRGHNAIYGILRSFDGRPPFLGRRTRPTIRQSGDTILFMAYCVVLMGGRLSWAAELGQPCFPIGPKTKHCQAVGRCNRARASRATRLHVPHCRATPASPRSSPQGEWSLPSGRHVPSGATGHCSTATRSVSHQTSTHRVQLDVARRSHQIRLVHHERGETSLPQIPRHFSRKLIRRV